MSEDLVILGAGQAAQSAIEATRAAGFDGRITLIGDERLRPYQRPPLSKAYLLGDMALDRLFFRPEDFYKKYAVEMKLGLKAATLDPAARSVSLSDGSTLSYDKLLLATGARPRRLPDAMGGALRGVFTMRDIADADAMAKKLKPSGRALVVGGGYIGLEAAAVLRKKGMEVTLLEREPRILARVACAETARYFTALHRDQGVDIRENAALERLEAGADGDVAAAVLADGERIEIDLAVVGVGVTLNAELAEQAGLTVENGVRVDAFAQSSDSAIFAAGDLACFELGGRWLRLESVQNAIDQGAVAGRAIAGQREKPYAPTPWFWSDQYDVKLQIAGLGDGAVDWVVRPGQREGAQSVWYFNAEGALLAVDAMNDGRAYLVGRKLLEQGAAVDKAAIANPETDLKSLM